MVGPLRPMRQSSTGTPQSAKSVTPTTLPIPSVHTVTVRSRLTETASQTNAEQQPVPCFEEGFIDSNSGLGSRSAHRRGDRLLDAREFYDWTGADQSRPAPVIPWIAGGLVLGALVAIALLAWAHLQRSRPHRPQVPTAGLATDSSIYLP